MRLLHPKTICLVAVTQDRFFKAATSSKKQIIAHAWSEIFKFMKSGKSHPKMFIASEYDLGVYTKLVHQVGSSVGCKLDVNLVDNYTEDFILGFKDERTLAECKDRLSCYFDSLYFFSDLNSLYYKGLNLFQFAFPNNWRKLVPVESLKEIHRQVEKSISKGCR